MKLEVLLAGVDKLTRPLRDAMAGSKDLAQAVKHSREQLKALERTQSNISGYKKQTAALQDTRAKLDQAQQRVRAMRDQMRAGVEQTDKFRKAFTKANESVHSLTSQVQRQTRDLAPLRAKLSEAGVKVAQLGSAETALKGKIDGTSEALKRQREQLEKVSRHQQRLNDIRGRYGRAKEVRDKMAGVGVASMAGGVATGVAALRPVMAYAEAEDASTMLKGAMMRKGGEVKAEFAEVNRLADRLGDRLPGTTADFQNMMTMLIRQGMTVQTILGGTGEAAAYLGVQLKLGPEAAAEFAAKMQDATGAAEKDMMGVMDVIQRTYYVGVDPSNMLNGFAKLAPVLGMIRQEGLKGAQALAPLLAMADQQNLVGESAGNAFRKVFQRSLDAKKVKKGNKLIQASKAGFKLDFSDGKGEFGGLDKMFNQLAQLKRLNTQTRNALIQEIWGDDAETLQALGVMIEKGQAGYREMQQKMADQASLQERVNQQLGTLKNLWDAASGTFTNAMVKFGESISPELKAVVGWITEASEKTGAWARENPKLANALMKGAAVLAIIMVTFGAFALVLATLIGPLALARMSVSTLFAGLSSGLGVLGRIGPALMTVLKVVGFVGRMMMFTPIGLAITAIAAAATLIYIYWEPIKAFFADIWAEIKTAFSGGVAGIAALILNWSPLGLFYRAFAAVMGWFGVELPNRFTGFGTMIIQGLVSGIKNSLGGVKDAILGVGDMLPEWLRNKLDIHSPSRVFAGIGGYTMAGLEQGIVKNQDGPLAALRHATGKLTALGAGVMLGAGPALAGQLDTRPPLARPAAAATAPIMINAPITIHAAPGMDERALARLVRQELEKAQRDAQVRQRSKFGDID
ncbi:phage tail tape measure protein [Chromobacterium rhizoryzae]|uniref:Phage tail tape measure protein n=2 Tax=Chromobacterium rhizoryzae TaxID=1778675 RepID=A0AAD0RU27_9NEIS|nr:phage tail tape measure protein [Chromobacterium rhizoryzae]